jgi:hypothetical protein
MQTHEEPLPEVTWDPREPETRKDHDPRGVLQDLAKLRLVIDRMRAAELARKQA